MRDVEIWLLKLFVLHVLIILIFVGCLEESVRVAIERSVLVGTSMARRLEWDLLCISWLMVKHVLE
jgi:hypothetical protein